MITRITEAPLKDKIVKGDATLERGWLQYFSNVNRVLQGFWGVQQATLTGVGGDVEHNILQFSGATLLVQIKIVNPVFSSTSLTIPNYTCFDSTLDLTYLDASMNISSIDKIYVEGNTANIPDSTGFKVAIISGSLIKKVGV